MGNTYDYDTAINRVAIFYKIVGTILLLALVGCSNGSNDRTYDQSTKLFSGDVYVYGEVHGEKSILTKELEIWGEHYSGRKMRHLFVELPFFTGELLNLWMRADDDTLLNEIYKDWEGTASYNTNTLEFFQSIKKNYPETVFHGTDVGHQYHTTAMRYLKYLEKENLGDSEQYHLALEGIEQGRKFYSTDDHGYRENKMVENFIRELRRIGNGQVMGIYGSAHINLNPQNAIGSVPSMAIQLQAILGEAIHFEDLSSLVTHNNIVKIDTIIVGEHEFEAEYFGKQSLTGFKNISYREFWHLKDAFTTFKNRPRTGNVLPYNNYPLKVEEYQVYVVDYTALDGSVEREFLRSNDIIWNGRPSTEEFIP